MRLKAYILAADPAWIEASVLSYYDLVDEIVVSYDENSVGWTGVPIAVDECLQRLRAIDLGGKMRYCPGHYARLDCRPMDNETFQRQCAIDTLGDGADWVLQLDTDEILLDSSAFCSCLADAIKLGFGAVDYPSRFLYRHIGHNRYLEASSRFWKVAAGYPGPMSIRPCTRLRHARQCDVPPYRVDFRTRNTDLYRPKHAVVHRVVGEDQGIAHFAWIRPAEELLKKSKSSGHARDFDWDPMIRHWVWCGRHPTLAALTTPLRRSRHTKALRITSVLTPPGASASDRQLVSSSGR